MIAGRIGANGERRHPEHFVNRIESGDSSASDELLPIVYAELRKLIQTKLIQTKLAREKSGQTLRATAPVFTRYCFAARKTFATDSYAGLGCMSRSNSSG